MSSVLDVLDGFAAGVPDWPTLYDVVVPVLQNHGAMGRPDVEELLDIAQRCVDLRDQEMCWLAHVLAQEAIVRIRGNKGRIDQFERARLISADALQHV